MKLGFTGSKNGMTKSQEITFEGYLDQFQTHQYDDLVLHVGDCIGSDYRAANLAKRYGFFIIGHPPINNKNRVFFQYDFEYSPKPYLERNHDIVNESERLIATPGGYTEVLRSGTWATIRYAKKMKKQVTIIFPNGSVKTE